MNIYAYSLSLSVMEYQTAVLRGDMDATAEILPSIPKEQLNKVARFLEAHTEAETKWKALGDHALVVWRFDLVKEAFNKVGDLSSLMLLSLAVGNRDGVTDNLFPNNLAFATFFQLGDTQACMDQQSLVPKAVDAWHTELWRWNKSKISASIGHLSEHTDLFEEGWHNVLCRKVESR
ncbi:hypothetical protein EDD15DRAFT_2384733 [Pisolithus albus]|nr:hypothetical protein EDD15DRAFT_2384733 [Pisolithus albus]